MKKILLTEDDQDFSSVLVQYLKLHDFSVTVSNNGAEALQCFKTETFDICILDVMMPHMDGFKLAEELTAVNPEIPFIFLTAKQLKEDKIMGLKLGADDYIVKPFEVDELILRLNNIIKRSESKNKITTPREFKIGRYIFNSQSLCLKIENKTIQLTEKESLIIQFLYQNKNQLIKREQILQAVWNTDDYFSGRSMDVFITKIRKHFQEDSNISIISKRFLGLEFNIKQ